MQEFGYIRLHRLSGEPDMVRIMSIDIEHLYSCNRDWQGSSRISTFDGFMSSSFTVQESVPTIRSMIADHDHYFMAEAFALLRRNQSKMSTGGYYDDK